MNLRRKIVMIKSIIFAFWTLNGYSELNTEVISERLAPVGQVCLQGDECASGALASSAGGAKTAESTIEQYCSTCHVSGLLGAPKIGDNADWTARAEEQGGLDALVAAAIKGINAMPPRGTCADCSDDDIRAAVIEMSGLE